MRVGCSWIERLGDVGFGQYVSRLGLWFGDDKPQRAGENVDIGTEPMALFDPCTESVACCGGYPSSEQFRELDSTLAKRFVVSIVPGDDVAGQGLWGWIVGW